MSIEQITEVLKSEDVAMSAKGIAIAAGCDATSELCVQIKDLCWEAIEAGQMLVTTVIETEQQFFHLPA